MQLTNLPTLLSTDRIANIVKYSYYATRHEGHVAEFGAYKGGISELLAKMNPNTTCYCIDSFAGLPAPTTNMDFHNEGDFSDNDYASIAGYFKLMHPNVKVLRGFSPDVFTYFDSSVKFRFVHIDVDLYSSVMDALTFFVPRMVLGGIIICDDYLVNSTPGAKKAIDEYFSQNVFPGLHRQELKYFDTESSDTNNQYLIVR